MSEPSTYPEAGGCAELSGRAMGKGAAFSRCSPFLWSLLGA